LAQTAAIPQIIVASTIKAEPGTRVLFPIRIFPDAPRNSFLRVRGLPTTTSLSEGHLIAPGSWAISVATSPNLSITLASVPDGSFDMLVTLLTVDGAVLNEAKCVLEVSTAPPPLQPEAGSFSPAALPRPVLPRQFRSQMRPPALSMTPEKRTQALRLLQRGDGMLAEGNIAPARLLYERATELGLAEAAMALAATYDPAEFPRLNVQGIEPNPEEARRWYERARQLGADEADQRLRRLEAN
jgi:hypothetical protein